jgi:hypothetical protein
MKLLWFLIANVAAIAGLLLYVVLDTLRRERKVRKQELAQYKAARLAQWQENEKGMKRVAAQGWHGALKVRMTVPEMRKYLDETIEVFKKDAY